MATLKYILSVTVGVLIVGLGWYFKWKTMERSHYRHDLLEKSKIQTLFNKERDRL